jgi:hypothetical protein
MARLIGAAVVAVLVSGLGGTVRAGDGKDGQAAVDKAIKALGGADKLGKVQAFAWKGKGKIVFGGNENDFGLQVTAQGVDHFRQDFEGDFNGTPVKGVTVLAGDKGWRKFGDMDMELTGPMLDNEKRSVYMQVIATNPTALKSKGFKVQAGGEVKVDGKPAVGVKVTGPDGKDFQLFFDKESGLPVKMVAKVAGFKGEEATQETTYANYKEFDGIKKATKVATKRDGERFIEVEVTEFRVLDKVDAKTFTEPQ